MDILINTFILILSVTALWLGAVWIVESATHIAKKLGISELVIGLTVVAFGTSAPEFAVTLTAALKNQPDISVGNIIGSNVFNLGFILGGVAMIRALSTSAKLVYRDSLILLGITLLLPLFLGDLTLQRWEGIILMLGLISYLGLLFFSKEQIDEEVLAGDFKWLDVIKLLAGLGLIIAGGHYLVQSASFMARLMGISEWVIAVTIVAAGTSAPEFATSLVAVVKGQHGLSVGNLIGSTIFNLLGVLGFAAILHPMNVSSAAYGESLMLIGLVFFVILMMRSGWRITRFEGTLLVLINLIRWIYIFSK